MVYSLKFKRMVGGWRQFLFLSFFVRRLEKRAAYIQIFIIKFSWLEFFIEIPKSALSMYRICENKVENQER